MGTDINFRKHLGRTYGTYIGLPAFDPSAAAYFTATGITGATQQTAIDNLVKGLKADGLWSKMKAVYPFVTDNRNLMSYTEDFSNAYWTKDNCSVIANNITAPNGTSTADRVTINSINAEHLVWNPTVLASTAGQYTSSVYLKKGNSDYIQVANNGANSANYAYIIININNGNVTQSGASGSYTLNSSQVTSVGDGWYRCSITYTTSSDEARGLRVRFSNSATPVIGGYGTITFVGNGTDFYYLWGAQFETGALTTYQPIATTQQAFISSQFKFNLVNPVDSDAAFRLVFNGGWTHSSNGATPNGTNGYADTRLIPNTNLTLNSASFSVYSRNNFTPAANQSWGCSSAIGNLPLIGGTMFPAKNVSSYVYSYNAPDILTSSINQNLAAMFLTTRTATNNAKLFRNTTQIAAVTAQNQITQPTNRFYFGAINSATQGVFDYSTFQYSFAHIGDGLTDTEAANLYTRVQAFQTALNRQV